MARKTQRLCTILFTSCLSFSSFAQDSIQHELGQWTQIEGSSSFLEYKVGIRNPVGVKLQDKIKTEGSYLSNEDGFMTGKFFDNCWIRLGPKTKIVFTLSQADKTLHLKVFTGSVKVLFNREWTKGKAEKLVLESGDKQMETESGKFVFIRKPFFNENNLYVEKGLVSLVHENNLQTQLIHQNEKTSFNDKTRLSTEVAKMNEREREEISKELYLKHLGQQSL